MIVWIASSGRSGNTFFRVVMHHLYGIETYAAFQASEVLVRAGAEGLVGYKEMPQRLGQAIATRDSGQIKAALEELDRAPELFVFKTHAMAHELYGTSFPAILIVRDGRDAIASYANYLIDIRFDANARRHKLGKMVRSREEMLNPRSWKHLGKMLLVSAAKKAGLRQRLVSRKIDRLLNPTDPLFFDWAHGNRSWLERAPAPVVVYFNDLVRDPITTVKQAVARLHISLAPHHDAAVPSFATLKEHYPNFFRRGTSGDWRNHFSPAQERRFVSTQGEMMRKLEFPL